MKRSTPSSLTAITKFCHIFKNEISIQAEFSDFEATLIENVFERRFFLQAENFENWLKLVRTYHYFINHGSFKNAKEIAIAFLNTTTLMSFQLNKAYDYGADLRNLKGSPAFKIRIEKAFSYYKLLYEGVYRILISPILYGYYFYANSKDKKLIPKADGKVGLTAIENIEPWKSDVEKRLSYGLNSHIRNAYGHENFRILDDGFFEVWDYNPNSPDNKWGPEKWHIDDLESLCHRLEQSIEATILALCLYSVNNRKLIADHGWRPTINAPKLTREEIKINIEHFAAKLSFGIKECNFTERSITLIIETRPRGIDQDIEIFEGGNTFSRRYTQNVKYYEAFNVAQVLGLFQRIESDISDYETISCEVRDPDNNTYGIASIKVSDINKLPPRGRQTLKEARSFLLIDTLGETKMWYEVKDVPKLRASRRNI
jgi:hypothetical protein